MNSWRIFPREAHLSEWHHHSTRLSQKSWIINLFFSLTPHIFFIRSCQLDFQNISQIWHLSTSSTATLVPAVLSYLHHCSRFLTGLLASTRALFHLLPLSDLFLHNCQVILSKHKANHSSPSLDYPSGSPLPGNKPVNGVACGFLSSFISPFLLIQCSSHNGLSVFWTNQTHSNCRDSYLFPCFRIIFTQLTPHFMSLFKWRLP